MNSSHGRMNKLSNQILMIFLSEGHKNYFKDHNLAYNVVGK